MAGLQDSTKGIQQAFQDYQMGVNGFEGAHGWRSEIGKKVRRLGWLWEAWKLIGLREQMT